MQNRGLNRGKEGSMERKEGKKRSENIPVAFTPSRYTAVYILYIVHSVFPPRSPPRCVKQLGVASSLKGVLLENSDVDFYNPK